MGSGEKEGKIFYFPDIASAPPVVVKHWADRARALIQPLLKARYADLAWEMTPVVANERRDPEMARIAIDAYLLASSIETQLGVHRQAEDAVRALNLSALIHDNERVETAKRALIDLVRTATAGHQVLWNAFDRLIDHKNVGLTDDEDRELIASLENLTAYFADSSDPDQFNPHAAQDCAKRLIRNYTRTKKPNEVKRLHTTIARAFEHFAGLGDALLASAVLQTAVNSYKAAGLTDESNRVRRLMEERIGQSRDEMSAIESEIKIKKDEIF